MCSSDLSRYDLSSLNFEFVNKRKYAYIFSGSLAIIGLVSIVTKGFDYGVAFSGGRSYVVQFPDSKITTEEVNAELTKSFGIAPEVKTYGGGNKMSRNGTAPRSPSRSTSER